ncbi:MAG: DUF5050 domain-containing protein, partial [bacterium]|nr:DUF5050 domain-containing protein [bacterium]
MAFDIAAAGQRDIHVISADGGAPRRITTHPATDAMPSWSRDGEWIYFASNRTGEVQVWKAPANGGELVQVTTQGGTAAFESPDGEFLYYAKTRGETSLWRIPVAGGPATQILDGAFHTAFTVGARGIYFPSRASNAIEFFSFTSGETSPIISLDENRSYNLSVSP